MAYTDQAALAADATFGGRVRVAMVTAAIQVAAEAQGSQDSAVYAKRQILANAVLLNSGSSYLDVFAWAVAENAAITGSSVDGDIQFQVNSVWNAVAGVRAATD